MPRRYYGCAVSELVRVIGPSISYLPLTKGHYCLLDSDPPRSVTEFNWLAVYVDKRGVFLALRIDYSVKRTKKLLHREICQTVHNVDHINGNTLDNRRANLRPATTAENSRNRGATRKSSSGIKNVYPYSDKWRVAIRLNSRLYDFGVFTDKHEAEQVALAKSLELHGSFSHAARQAQFTAMTGAK